MSWNINLHYQARLLRFMMIKNCWKMKKRGRKFREKREKAEEETWKWVDKDEASRQKERSIGMNLASIDSCGIPAGKIDNCKRWLTRLSKSKSWISIKESCRRSKARPQRASSFSYWNEWSVAFSSLFLIIFEKYSSESWESWSSLFIYTYFG